MTEEKERLKERLREAIVTNFEYISMTPDSLEHLGVLELEAIKKWTDNIILNLNSGLKRKEAAIELSNRLNELYPNS